jgi:hypothetical protein
MDNGIDMTRMHLLMGANGGFNKIGYGTVISKAIFKKDLTAK